MSSSVPNEVLFVHVVLEGTPYEVGRLQGEMLRDDQDRARYLTPTLPFLESYSKREAHRALGYFEKYCPGIMEEIQGAADAFGVPVENIAFLGGKSKEDGSSAIPVDKPVSCGGCHCSHFAILPAASEDGHLYAGQNEDCGPGDLDLRLCTTRVQGKAAHIGFSDMIFGRVQGMNEHDFCVTTSCHGGLQVYGWRVRDCPISPWCGLYWMAAEALTKHWTLWLACRLPGARTLSWLIGVGKQHSSKSRTLTGA
jgi:hypothetical protein